MAKKPLQISGAAHTPIGAVPALVLAFALLFPLALGAHEIPNDVVITGFLRVDGPALRLLLRVPMNAMRDAEFPETPARTLDLSRASKPLADAVEVWIRRNLSLREDERRLEPLRTVAIRVSLPSDKSFASFSEASAHLKAPQQELGVVWSQAMLDVGFETPIRSDKSRFSLESGLARLGVRTVTVLRFSSPGGAERVFEWRGDPGLVRLDPSWSQAAGRFIKDGFFHILSGVDHLLLLVCLVLPVRRWRTLVPVVTAFTVAHSITLAASAYGMAPDALWFPPLVETLIAASIVAMAFENIVRAAREEPLTLLPRWAMAFAFGLVHGFGFSFALRETLQFAGTHLVSSLAAFNIGVELGQLAALLILVPAVSLLFVRLLGDKLGVILISAIIAHTGWHWMVERGAQLWLYDWASIEFGAAQYAAIFRWLFGLAMAAMLISLLRERWSRR